MYQFIAKLKKYLGARKRYGQLYSNFIKKGDLCFDVGANIGYRTQAFLDLGARVISIEPAQESLAILSKKYKAQKNVTIVSCAVGRQSGEGKLHLSNHSELASLSDIFIEKYSNIPEVNIEWSGFEIVRIKTLDQLIEEYGVPKFCKIDVEGFEFEALSGLSTPIEYISFEYNSKMKDLALKCINYFQKFDHVHFNFSPYETMVFSLYDWLSLSEFYTYIEGLSNDILTGDIYVRIDS